MKIQISYFPLFVFVVGECVEKDNGASKTYSLLLAIWIQFEMETVNMFIHTFTLHFVDSINLALLSQ